MILEYTSVHLLLQYASLISRFFIYGKNSDGAKFDYYECQAVTVLKKKKK